MAEINWDEFSATEDFYSFGDLTFQQEQERNLEILRRSRPDLVEQAPHLFNIPPAAPQTGTTQPTPGPGGVAPQMPTDPAAPQPPLREPSTPTPHAPGQVSPLPVDPQQPQMGFVPTEGGVSGDYPMPEGPGTSPGILMEEYTHKGKVEERPLTSPRPGRREPALASNGTGSGAKRDPLTREYQDKLVAVGHDTAIDGWFGDETEAAVKEFQSRMGLPVSGTLTQRTMDALDQEEYKVNLPEYVKEFDALPEGQRDRGNFLAANMDHLGEAAEMTGSGGEVDWKNLDTTNLGSSLKGLEGLSMGESLTAVFGEDRAKAIESTIQSESRGKLVAENMGYSLSRALEVFPSKYHARIQAVFSDPSNLTSGRLNNKGLEAFSDVVYGGRMGNREPGDGFKYRGRGYIQITGRTRYKRLGEAIGVDLEANPDLMLDPEVAKKATIAYFYDKRETDGSRRDIFGPMSASKLSSIIGHATNDGAARWSNTGLPSRIPKYEGTGEGGYSGPKTWYGAPIEDGVDGAGYTDMVATQSQKNLNVQPLPEPKQLGMIGGVRDGTRVWQSFGGSGMAHSSDYRDYSQLYREYTTTKKKGYVEVGKTEDGQTVYAAPDYLKDKDGNYVKVSKDDAIRIAGEMNALMPTRDWVKSAYSKATRVPMPTQPIYKTPGSEGDSALYTRKINEAFKKKGIKPGAFVVHGKEFFVSR